MALEKLLAYLDGKPMPSDATVTIGPDEFAMPESSDLKAEQEFLSGIIERLTSPSHHRTDGGFPEYDQVCNADFTKRTRYLVALLERTFAFELRNPNAGTDYRQQRISQYFNNGEVDQLFCSMLRNGVDYDLAVLPLTRWIAAHPEIHRHANTLIELLRVTKRQFDNQKMPEQVIDLLKLIRSSASEGWHKIEPAIAIVDELLGAGIWQQIFPGEVWSDKVIADLTSMPPQEQQQWQKLLALCKTATSAKPSTKWTKTASQLLEPLNKDDVTKYLVTWLNLVEKGRSRPSIASGQYQPVDYQWKIQEHNMDLLRGLVWLCPHVSSRDICRAVSRVTATAYKKVKGIGPRAVKIGNAGVYILGEFANEDAVGQLAILKVRVKFGTAQIGIEKALTATAEKVGIPRAELEEMSVPGYGMTEVGTRHEEFGDYKAELVIDGPDIEIKWFNPEGKQLKSAPTAVTKEKEFFEDLKELKQAAADIEKMIPAQAARIEQTYLQTKKWVLATWQQRYIDHPLVGAIARRLIWNFEDAGKPPVSAIFHNGQFVNFDGQPVGDLAASCTVTLWHPLDRDNQEIGAWRDWLFQNRVKQPFKQAHREIYILTDAEKNTETYSNRFAAHIVKQHQFNALCSARGWKNKLRLMVDDAYPPPHLELPAWGIRAEYWVESVGTDYGVDTNESGTYLYLSTDQVRFYEMHAAQNLGHAGGGGYTTYGADRHENHPLTLDRIPPIVFSEVMRDVDLFVGVSSLGNDPTWSDGGPGGRYREYWHSFSFGSLGTSAELRKTVLQRLVPMLKIADRCSFSDRFMIVRGDIRTYKIHLGSGNILMEPNDQYLCIVPKQSVSAEKEEIFLPFEGDNMMSVILSKAFLLAEDKKIKDASITSQIGKAAVH